jgi:uncharacterized protein (DUF486 family)
VRTIALLIASNVLMTAAWYGHLRFKDVTLWKVILVSWGIAFVEYCLQVPANRWGHQTFSAFQLKLMQEVITLVVFTGFAVVWLKETPKWNHGVAAVFLVGAVVFAFWDRVPALSAARG